MDWEAIGRGGWPDNAAFAALSPEAQLAEIWAAVRWVEPRQRSDPMSGHRVAVAALHLLDSQGHSETRLRAVLALILGATALNLGDEDEALLHFGEILRRPEDPESYDERDQALIHYASLISARDHERAYEMLGTAVSTALQQGHLIRAANASITLGSLQRDRKQWETARRTYEKAIHDLGELEPRDPDTARILARLHGNLGNVLTDDLALHQEAADHYAKAVALFEAADEGSFADDRYFHLICARLSAGEHGAALRLLKDGLNRIGRHSEGFLRLLQEGHCLSIPESELPAWLTLFEQILATAPEALTAAGEALLLSTQIVIRVRLGDATGAIARSRDPRLRSLPECDLWWKQTPLIAALAMEYDCHGMLWSYPWSADVLDNAQRVSLKTRYVQELATAWLFSQAQQPVEGPLSDERTLREIFGPPVKQGIGSAPEEPPTWLGPAPPEARERYARLRRACPSQDELKREFSQCYYPSLTPHGQPLAHSEAPLRAAVRAADLLGHPELMVTSRVSLASSIAGPAPQGSTTDRLLESLEILREARTVADGLPREEVRVSITTATILKESHGGDEAARIEAAIEEGRRAMDLAERHGFRTVLPLAAGTLGNALSDYADARLPRLLEARTVLEKGLTALRAEPPADAEFMEATLLNSLGLVFQKIGELENPRDNRLAAAGYYRKALALRERLGDPDRELTTLMTFLGCLFLMTKERGATSNPEAVRLAQRIQRLAPRAVDPVLRATSLSNAAIALKTTDPDAAKEAQLESVRGLRGMGPSRYLIQILTNAGQTHLELGDAAAARELLEEAVSVIDEFRPLGKSSRYRAELTRSFGSTYRLLGSALERLGAPDEDKWWVVERGTGRTLAEGRGEAPARDDVFHALRNALPADTILLQIYVTKTNELACFVLQHRNGRLNVRDGGRRLPLSSLAVRTGDAADDRHIRIPLPTPEHAEQFHYQMSWISSHFLGPLLNDIDLAGIKGIVIASRDLRHLPWHSMPTPTGERLGRTFEVIRVPSAAFLARVLGTPDPPVRKAAFVACDPSGTLKRHIQECRHAFSTLSVPDKIVLTDISRPLSKGAALSILKETDLFHFAGHSTMITDRPDQSGLLFSDGLLSVPELEVACAERAPSMVFLSSCESAAEDTVLEDALNLSTVFLQAGARVVIGASWQVPDSIAAFTARKFYENLATAGPIASLRRAQTQMMDTVASAHWAAFVLQGWSVR
ncbi:CHAT domain-containing tetratricopeptide repeat protein [Streptomyces sp. NBC_01381]|uniref:CHAT domain-containing protein n=1 Tax=Streptomyces sp. NBC_01381 TaxID=2903845 RepID=UPI00225171DB|nr:CHAT domain-containing tetratricopeptide repeat protein [Streptomyces sp. NBC_01381]MCX4668822.1 CHAT domain-containing tetratricopeptide repeat protein [Streptomyces sp. NBC_01381]